MRHGQALLGARPVRASCPAGHDPDVFAAFIDLTGRVLQRLEEVSPEEAAAVVPGLTWTVAECAAHLLSLFRRMTGDARRSPDPAGVARLNALANAEIGRDLEAIRGEIESLLGAICELALVLPHDRRFEFHAGRRVTYGQYVALLVAELVVHGDDIARATGRGWPVSAADIRPVWRLAVPVLGGWLRPSADVVTESWALLLPDRPPVVLEIDRGVLRVGGTPGRDPDHMLAVPDPVAFTLAFPYGRRPIQDPSLARLASYFFPV
jgi:hypothetical protein